MVHGKVLLYLTTSQLVDSVAHLTDAPVQRPLRNSACRFTCCEEHCLSYADKVQDPTDKTVVSRPIIVDGGCHARVNSWVPIGWAVRHLAPDDRDFILPALASSCRLLLSGRLQFCGAEYGLFLRRAAKICRSSEVTQCWTPRSRIAYLVRDRSDISTADGQQLAAPDMPVLRPGESSSCRSLSSCETFQECDDALIEKEIDAAECARCLGVLNTGVASVSSETLRRWQPWH